MLTSVGRREASVYSGEYLRRSCEWRSIQTKSNADLIVSERIHQAYYRFSDVSKGRQCAFMSL